MCIATTLHDELNRLGMTHEELAKMMNYSRQSVTAWATGKRRIPEDAKRKLAAISPRLALEIISDDPANIFMNGWLDGEVDLSVSAMKEKIAEELEEMARSLRNLHLVNKTRPEHLNDIDRKQISEATQEGLDLITGIPVMLIKLYETYKMDLIKEAEKHRKKLFERKYKKKNPAMKRALKIKLSYA